jgi:hypothetical protein
MVTHKKNLLHKLKCMIQRWWLIKLFFMQINLHDSRMVTHKKKSLHMKRAMWCAGLYEFSYLVFFFDI